MGRSKKKALKFNNDNSNVEKITNKKEIKEAMTLINNNNNFKNKTPLTKPTFTDFSFLLDHYSETDLHNLQINIKNIQDILITLVKYQGYDKEKIITFTGSLIERMHKEMAKNNIDNSIKY